MPDLCCLLGLCCPPAERRIKIAAWLAMMTGVSAQASATHADTMIAQLDADPFVQQLQAMVLKSKG